MAPILLTVLLVWLGLSVMAAPVVGSLMRHRRPPARSPRLLSLPGQRSSSDADDCLPVVIHFPIQRPESDVGRPA